MMTSKYMTAVLVEHLTAHGHALDLDGDGVVMVEALTPSLLTALEPHATALADYLRQTSADAASVIAKAQRAAQRRSRKAA